MAHVPCKLQPQFDLLLQYCSMWPTAVPTISCDLLLCPHILWPCTRPTNSNSTLIMWPTACCIIEPTKSCGLYWYVLLATDYIPCTKYIMSSTATDSQSCELWPTAVPTISRDHVLLCLLHHVTNCCKCTYDIIWPANILWPTVYFVHPFTHNNSFPLIWPTDVHIISCDQLLYLPHHKTNCCTFHIIRPTAVPPTSCEQLLYILHHVNNCCTSHIIRPNAVPPASCEQLVFLLHHAVHPTS